MTLYYFAYGSNMSLPRLQQRAPSARIVATASLPGHRLRFDKAGRDGSAKCDASFTACQDDIVHGVLYHLDQQHKARLDAAEGLGGGYEQKRVLVHQSDGVESAAITYYATLVDQTLRPYSWYLEHVIRGALEHGLPDHYTRALSTIETTEDPNIMRHQMELSIYNEALPVLESKD